MKDNVKYLTACLCALVTELKTMGIAEDVVSNAQKKEKVNIKEFWKNHNVKDKERLIKKFNELSDHEKELYKQLLKNGEI